MAKFFNIPFANSGSKEDIPDTSTTEVSWNSGYTINYSYNPVSNTQAKHIEREKMNKLFYDITSSIRELQLNGVSPYYEAVIAATGPGYSIGALVLYNGNIWRSKVTGNRNVPSINATTYWELVYGYDGLVEQLKSDGYLSGSGSGGGSGNGYSKNETDQLLANLRVALLEEMNYFLEKKLGEVYLLTWCNQDRNNEGFFLCNGDLLPFIPEGGVDDGSNPLTFYGTQLYNLCYTIGDDGVSKIESDFKKRWNIVINSAAKTIQLPNILGLDNNEYASENQSVALTLGLKTTLPSFDDSSAKTFGAIDKPTAKTNGDLVYRLTMLPCLYLGIKV